MVKPILNDLNFYFLCNQKLKSFHKNILNNVPLLSHSAHAALRPQRTLDLEYQDGGDELQNLITEITAMRDLGLFISVGGTMGGTLTNSDCQVTK